MTEKEAIGLLMDSYIVDFAGDTDQQRMDLEKFLISILEEIQQYREIGTVEECREAVERQKAKKPRKKLNKYSNTYKCPNCDCEFIHKDETGWFCGKKYKFCPDCGRAIDWNEEA